MTESEKLRNVIGARFIRRGRIGEFTNLFEQFSEADRQLVFDAVEFLVDELPVVLCLESSTKWLLATTTRILSCTDGDIRAIDYNQIADARAVLPDVINYDQGIDLASIEITLFDGSRQRVSMERGDPCFGMLNILVFIVDRNNHRQMKWT